MVAQLNRALSLLTVAPTGRSGDPETGSTDVAAWFPLVGLLVGGALYVSGVTLEFFIPIHAMSEAVAVILMIVSAGITRMMHWDGIADVADGLWGGYDAPRRREIASDSQVGSFGVTALILYALASYVLIAALIDQSLLWTLPTIWAISRFSATSGAWWGRPAKSSGLGASISSAPTLSSMLICLVTLMISTLLPIAAFAENPLRMGIAVGAGLLLAAAVPHVLSRPFGGTTGDVFGSSIAVSEIIGMGVILMGAMT